jgi:hypothetical protein
VRESDDRRRPDDRNARAGAEDAIHRGTHRAGRTAAGLPGGCPPPADRRSGRRACRPGDRRGDDRDVHPRDRRGDDRDVHPRDHRDGLPHVRRPGGGRGDRHIRHRHRGDVADAGGNGVRRPGQRSGGRRRDGSRAPREKDCPMARTARRTGKSRAHCRRLAATRKARRSPGVPRVARTVPRLEVPREARWAAEAQARRSPRVPRTARTARVARTVPRLEAPREA